MEDKIRRLLAKYGAAEEEINNFMGDLANEKEEGEEPAPQNEIIQDPNFNFEDEEDFGWYDEDTISKLSATQEGKELIANAPEMAKEELERMIKKFLGNR